jgi:hypothetical protein
MQPGVVQVLVSIWHVFMTIAALIADVKKRLESALPGDVRL